MRIVDFNIDRDEWRHRAACRGEDPELWFPLTHATAQIRVAKDICVDCPVQSECLEWAIATGQDFGIWGGLTSDERRVLRRQNLLV